MSLSFYVGSCRVRLGFSCFALVAFCCLFTKIENGAFFMMAVILHESAHFAAMYAFRVIPASFSLSALGCRMVVPAENHLTLSQSAVVSLAGPGANWAAFLVFSLFHQGGHPFAMACLALGGLHILPIEPLDGGLALHSFLSGKIGENKAAVICRAVSVIFLIPFATLGFLVLLRSRSNFSLLALSLYLMLYLVLKWDYMDV